MSSHCTHCNLFNNYTIIQKIVTWTGQFKLFLVLYVCRVPTASGNQGNQGKLKGIFPVREKSGNLVFFPKMNMGKNICLGFWHICHLC